MLVVLNFGFYCYTVGVRIAMKEILPDEIVAGSRNAHCNQGDVCISTDISNAFSTETYNSRGRTVHVFCLTFIIYTYHEGTETVPRLRSQCALLSD